MNMINIIFGVKCNLWWKWKCMILYWGFGRCVLERGVDGWAFGWDMDMNLSWDLDLE
jgi:hypothetical protein